MKNCRTSGACAILLLSRGTETLYTGTGCCFQIREVDYYSFLYKYDSVLLKRTFPIYGTFFNNPTKETLQRLLRLECAIAMYNQLYLTYMSDVKTETSFIVPRFDKAPEEDIFNLESTLSYSDAHLQQTIVDCQTLSHIGNRILPYSELLPRDKVVVKMIAYLLDKTTTNLNLEEQ